MVFMRVGVVLGLCAASNGEVHQKPKRWWQHAAGMRSISPLCNNMNFSELLASVDDVHASGTTIFSVNAAYDSGFGYDYGGLWCGLAISDLMGVNNAIGSQAAWNELEQKVHSKNMSLVTWMNPSYFWTGSSAFKSAEQDIKKYGVNSSEIPTTSTALWFRWRKESMTMLDNVTKPSDSLDWSGDPPPASPGSKGWVWVWSPEANASYLSVWGHQPTTDWLSSQWQEYFRTVVSHWIDEMHVDGFVFDFPDGYVGTGSSNSHLQLWEDTLWSYNPDIMKQYLTDVVRDVGDDRVAAFAELYPDDWSVERGSSFGFDGIISDDAGYGNFQIVAATVQQGNADVLEMAFIGQGGPDALRSQCFHLNTGDCAVPWTRFVVGTPWLEDAQLAENSYDCTQSGATYVQKNGVMSLEQCFGACADDEHCEAITVGWNARSPIAEVDCYKLGNLTIRECNIASSECEPCPFKHSTFALDASVKLRQAVAVTVAGGNLLAVELGADGAWWSSNDWPGRWDPALAKLQQTFEHNAAFDLLSLRVQLPVTGAGHYAMIRYDHSGTGLAAVVAFNFEAQASSVNIDLSLLARAFGEIPIDLLTGKPAATLENIYSVDVPAHGMALLGFEGLGVWKQHGNTICPDGFSPHMVSLDACLLECLSKEFCNAVSVQWLATSHDQVACRLHNTVELSNCIQAGDADHAAFFLSSPEATDVSVV